MPPLPPEYGHRKFLVLLKPLKGLEKLGCGFSIEGVAYLRAA
jgi:hypothetical protein